MGFQDVEFLSSRASCYITFLRDCGGAEGLPIAMRLNSEVGVCKGTLLVKYFLSNKSSFCVGFISFRSQRCHENEVNLATHGF